MRIDTTRRGEKVQRNSGMSSWGDKLTYAAGVIKDYTDPVAKLAADAYESIAGSGFKPIKKASDADVKRLTEALRKSASSTEMLAKVTESETAPASKPAQNTAGGSASRALLSQAPQPEQKSSAPRQNNDTSPGPQRAEPAQKLESKPRAEQAERPRIFTQLQQEAALTRVQAEQPLDSRKQNSVLDFTSKLRDAASAVKESQQAKDDKFLSSILTGAQSDSTGSGAVRFNTIPITRQDWEVISNAKDQTEAPSLPKLEIISTTFGSDSRESTSTRYGFTERTTEPGANGEDQKDDPRRVVQKADGSLFYDEGHTSIARLSTGQVRLQGANGAIDIGNGKLVALDKDGNAYLGTSPEGKTRAALGNGRFVLPGMAGVAITDALGKVIGKIEADQIVTNHASLQEAHYPEEANFKNAMERWRKDGNKLEPGKTSLLMHFKSGFAIVEPENNQYTVVLFKEDKKFEIHQKLADGVTVVKDADNRFFLTTKKNRLELSRAQVDVVLKDLPEGQSKNLLKIMSNLEKGVLDVTDGKLVLKKDGEAEFTQAIAGVAGLAVPSVKVTINASANELVEKRADGTQTTTQFDRASNTYSHKETNAKGEVTETKFELKHGPQADGVRVTGRNWFLENGLFTNSDGFKIDRDGTVRTPGGSEVHINGDIRYSNGMILEGGVLKEPSKLESAQTAPTEKHVEALVRTGLSLAKSLASGGPATFAQIALLQANLSIVSNLVGLFSEMGQLQEATKLFKVWATMNESLCKARAEVEERTTRTNSDKISLFSRVSDRFSSNTAGSGGWISCHLKAA